MIRSVRSSNRTDSPRLRSILSFDNSNSFLMITGWMDCVPAYGSDQFVSRRQETFFFQLVSFSTPTSISHSLAIDAFDSRVPIPTPGARWFLFRKFCLQHESLPHVGALLEQLSPEHYAYITSTSNNARAASCVKSI